MICNEELTSKEKLEEHIKVVHAVRKLLEYDSYGTICRATEKIPRKFISEVNARSSNRLSLLENSQIIMNSMKHNLNESSMEVPKIEDNTTLKENDIPVSNTTVRKPKKKYECVFCAKILDKKVQLTKHLQLHEISVQDKKCFKCKKCTASFNDLTRLALHVRGVHDKLKIHNCPKCSVVCASQGSLRAHMHVHDTSKPGPGYVPHINGGYKCSTCGARLASRTSINTHLARHSSARPFACTTCPATFKTKGGLSQHLATQHEPPKFPCPACERVFNYKYALLQHLATHVQAEKEKC